MGGRVCGGEGPGEGLGRVWGGSGEGLGEDRRVVGDVGGWGDFGGFVFWGVGKSGWETGLSKAYPRLILSALDKPLISPFQFSTNPEHP